MKRITLLAGILTCFAAAPAIAGGTTDEEDTAASTDDGVGFDIPGGSDAGRTGGQGANFRQLTNGFRKYPPSSSRSRASESTAVR